MSIRTPLTIGTRGSPLALAQADLTKEALIRAEPALAAEDAIIIRVIRTTGDMIQDRTLADIGGKGLFTKEIDDALLEGSIDLAVHSMKDVPTYLPEGTAIAACLPRADPRDALIARGPQSLAELPEGAVVGTASLRRMAQALAARPDLEVVPFRGNVQTRLRKLGAGEVAATFLAVAGLARLGLADSVGVPLEPGEMLPAVAQGAIGLQARTDDSDLLDLLARLGHADTLTCVAAERAFLAALEGSCRTPIAAWARLEDGGTLRLSGLVARPDGSEVRRTERHGTAADGEAIGADAGAELRAGLPPGFLTVA